MPKSIYSHKESNILKTWILFAAFFGVVIGTGYVFAEANGNPAILYFAVLFSVITSFASYWFSDTLVLSMYHARPISMENAPELYRIVENLAITAGLPIPRIYIVPEDQPNAFATGRNSDHAVVAVTEGLLKRLNRSELEGVLAHELSHIGNKDMLISTAAVILVGFISILSDFFTRSIFFGNRRDNNRGGGLFFFIGLILAVLAPLAATLMRLAISRKREFLADASGALLTRYPEGLASALEKISSDPTPMNSAKNITAHLWIDNPFRKEKMGWLHALFMTHPPVEERIRALRGMRVG